MLAQQDVARLSMDQADANQVSCNPLQHKATCDQVASLLCIQCITAAQTLQQDTQSQVHMPGGDAAQSISAYQPAGADNKHMCVRIKRTISAGVTIVQALNQCKASSVYR